MNFAFFIGFALFTFSISSCLAALFPIKKGVKLSLPLKKHYYNSNSIRTISNDTQRLSNNIKDRSTLPFSLKLAYFSTITTFIYYGNTAFFCRHFCDNLESKRKQRYVSFKTHNNDDNQWLGIAESFSTIQDESFDHLSDVRKVVTILDLCPYSLFNIAYFAGLYHYDTLKKLPLNEINFKNVSKTIINGISYMILFSSLAYFTSGCKCLIDSVNNSASAEYEFQTRVMLDCVDNELY